tara:strand:- start:4877 stop:6094 length:1218 start_codon:yes stop_codon:yes gene_type:complete
MGPCVKKDSMKSSAPLPREAFRASGKNIYLDHNATTPVASFVREAVVSDLHAWGNAGSIHADGRHPKSLLRESRKQVAELIGAHPLELVFTSGGSEANNTALKGFRNGDRKTVLTSAVEHPSVIRTLKYLEEQGIYKIIQIPVNRDGFMDMDFYQRHLDERVALVSIMYANNETGNIFPIKEMVSMAHEVGAQFHCDGVQSLGKSLVDVKDLGVDYMSFSAHKFYALKGVGALYIKKGRHLDPLIHGGAQERKRRAGTENTLAIASFGRMAERKDEIEAYAKEVENLRDYMESRILKEIDGVSITGKEAPRIGASSSLVLEGVDGETLLMNLDVKGFSVSTGAACSSGNPEPSPVLLAMGLSRQEAQSSLRLSLGWGTSQEDIDLFVTTLKEVVMHVRKIARGEI